MAETITTAERAFQVLNISDGSDKEDVRQFLRDASVRELEKMLEKCQNLHYTVNKNWLPLIATALQVKISEDATKAANMVVNNTKELSKQTDILIKESKGLSRLTWGLFWLTAVLAALTAGLLYIDWHGEHETRPTIKTK